MKLGVVFPQTEIGADPGGVRAFAQAARGARLRPPARLRPRARRRRLRPRRTGPGPYTSEHQFHEIFVLFGYLAAVAPGLELVTGVLVLPQRQTALVAKQAAEVDILTGGRFRLGVGLGWNFVEFEALGEDFREPRPALEEQIEVLRRLWTEPVVDFEGRWHRIPRAGINPLPVQRPIPIWIGGSAEAAIRRTARLADGFFPQRPLEGGWPATMERFRGWVEEAGRDPAQIGIEWRIDIAEGTPDDWRREAEEWRALGATHLSRRDDARRPRRRRPHRPHPRGVRSAGIDSRGAEEATAPKQGLRARRSPPRTRPRATRSSSARACSTGRSLRTALVQIPLRMMNRHGLIAGATGTGKTKGLQGIAEQLSDAGVPVFAADMKGDLSGLSEPGGAGGIAADRWKELGGDLRADGVPGRVPRARRDRPRHPGARDRVRLRAAAARQGAAGERDPGAEPLARLPLRRPEGPAAPRPLRPARAPHLPRLRGRQGGADRHRRRRLLDDRRPAAPARPARGRRRHRVLRRAAARDRRPAADGRGRPRDHLVPRAARRPGQADALLDRADVAARRAVRGAAGDRRPRQAEARLLLRRGAPALRRGDEGVPRLDRPDRAADPLEGRRRLLLHAAAEGHPGRRARAARQPDPVRAPRVHARRRQGAEGDRLDVPEVRLLRPGGAAHVSWGSARRR